MIFLITKTKPVNSVYQLVLLLLDLNWIVQNLIFLNKNIIIY